MKKLLHKCTLGGLLVLLEDSCEDLRLCCSSTDCNHLFWRTYAVELEVPEEAILCEHTNDIDAHYQTGWDEIRISFKKEYVKRIIGSKRVKINDEDMIFCGRYGVISAHTDAEAKLQIKELFGKLDVTPIRKSGYSKEFLNIR